VIVREVYGVEIRHGGTRGEWSNLRCAVPDIETARVVRDKMLDKLGPGSSRVVRTRVEVVE
jgi:hypothetical protein